MRLLLPLFCAFTLASCGGSSGGSSATAPDPTPAPTASCVESHTADAGFHIMKRDDGSDITVELCDQGEKVKIRNDQVSRAADGNVDAVDIRHGRVTAYMSGIGDNDQGRMAFYVIFHGHVEDGRQQNIHAGLWGAQPFKHRFVRHWWAVDGAHPEASQREVADLPFDPAKTYRFEFIWSDTDVSVQTCEGGSAEEVAAVNRCSQRMQRPWGLPMKYMAEQQFLFGNKISKGYSFGNNVQVRGIRYTVFEAD